MILCFFFIFPHSFIFTSQKKNYQQQQPVARRFFLLFFHFHRKEKAFFSSHSISFSDFDIFIHKYFTLFTHYKIIPHEISLLCVLIGFNFWISWIMMRTAHTLVVNGAKRYEAGKNSIFLLRHKFFTCFITNFMIHDNFVSVFTMQTRFLGFFYFWDYSIFEITEPKFSELTRSASYPSQGSRVTEKSFDKNIFIQYFFPRWKCIRNGEILWCLQLIHFGEFAQFWNSHKLWNVSLSQL